MSLNTENLRSASFPEPRIFNASTNVMQTPLGNIRSVTQSSVPPPLPPPLYPQPAAHQMIGFPSQYGAAAGYGYGGNGGYTYNSLGGAYGIGNFGGYGSGFGNYGAAYGPHNRYGISNDPESRFIQLAEESSRPAFESIESLVGAIGNIAAMLDSTFFAITSSFRAILGVAANFGRLRSVFAKCWSTFAIFRGFNWIYRKLTSLFRLSGYDPNAFKEAFDVASQSATPKLPSYGTNQSPWPVIAFIGLIFSAPYIVMKLLGTVSESAIEECRNPRTWVHPLPSRAAYDFQARSQQELSLRAGQEVLIAPKEVQNTHKLLNTGWALATIDRQHSGLIPISYVQKINQSEIQMQHEFQKGTAPSFTDSTAIFDEKQTHLDGNNSKDTKKSITDIVDIST